MKKMDKKCENMHKYIGYLCKYILQYIYARIKKGGIKI